MNEAAQTPPMMIHLEAAVSESTRIHVSSTKLSEVAAIMAHFNLVESTTAAPAPAAGNGKGANKAAKPAPAPASTAETPAPTSAPAPAASASAPAATTGSDTVSPQTAADAVRAFGAKHGIDKAREVLRKHGFAATKDITADKAAAVLADVSEPQEL